VTVRPLLAVVLLAATLAAATPAPMKLPRYVASGDRMLPKVQYPDTLISVNKRCTVRQLLMGPTTRPVYVNRKPVGFCCRMCTWTWVMDPPRYINGEGLKFNCVVNPAQPAVIDTLHMVIVNWEYYFLSSAAAKATFLKNPLKYTGRLTDPVSRKRFTPRASAPMLFTEGRRYYFESAANRAKYQKDPAPYNYRLMD
jgi:YHS domain-containing protein